MRSFLALMLPLIAAGCATSDDGQAMGASAERQEREADRGDPAAGATRSVTEAQNGTTVTLAPGADLVVTLRGNRTTGYAWEVAAQPDALAAPRLTDLAMEMLGGAAQKQEGDAGDPDKRDNLFAPRADGTVHGGQSHHVRRSSLLLEAQKHPWAIPFLPGFAALRIAGRIAGHLPRPRAKLAGEW